MAQIVIPSVGIAMEEALLVRWLKQPGQAVVADEAVAEIETDKASMELTSPISGKLGPHLFEPGAIIPVGTVVVEVLTGDEEGSLGHSRPEEPIVGNESGALPRAAMAVGGTEGGRRPHALGPRGRRLAREGPVQVPPQAERFRTLIASKVAESWKEIPHFAVTREIDAEAMLATLDALRSRPSVTAPTLTDLFLRALALGLQERGHAGAVNLGLAVATDYGVVIPLVHDVLGHDAEALVGARAAAVGRARAGRLSPDDLEAPPSTLSNLGSYGVDQFTGIVALGQTSLLTVGRVAARLVADDTHTVRIRRTFFATLNADHRLVDGVGAARLLGSLAVAAETMTPTF
jgi:pyruvate dehydrogenase E2 component (dihydrolipoamide acetyltransferase)